MAVITEKGFPKTEAENPGIPGPKFTWDPSSSGQNIGAIHATERNILAASDTAMLQRKNL